MSEDSKPVSGFAAAQRVLELEDQLRLLSQLLQARMVRDGVRVFEVQDCTDADHWVVYAKDDPAADEFAEDLYRGKDGFELSVEEQRRPRDPDQRLVISFVLPAGWPA